MQIIETIEMIKKGTIRDYHVKKDKLEQIRNKNEIRQLRLERMENARLLRVIS